MNDLGQWLTDTERLLSESVGPDGQLELESARQCQEVSGRRRRGGLGTGTSLSAYRMVVLYREQQRSKYPKIADYYVFLFPAGKNSAVAQQKNKQTKKKSWRNDLKRDTLLITGRWSRDFNSSEAAADGACRHYHLLWP